jgi:glucose/arabinose dehydrogenase
MRTTAVNFRPLKNPNGLAVKTGLLLVFAVLMASGCTFRVGGLTRLTNPPAPTAIPLLATAGAPDIPGLIPPEKPIALPPGFGINVFAQGLSGPRMLAFGPDGNLYVADRGSNRVLRLIDQDGDGTADDYQVAGSKLQRPNSLAFYKDGSLYVGEISRVERLSQPDAQGEFQKKEVIIDGLPEEGHNTRTVLFSPDWEYLYLSVGSSCNVCEEQDKRRAAITRYRPDGSDEQIYASGLRNAVGMTLRPGTPELWATNNGRDMLGDDLPPDTVQKASLGDDFGWPRCHAGRIPDPEYGGVNACQDVAQPQIELQAHSAPLGLAFYNGVQFPPEYQDGLFVAYHGSWNRSEPTGYKLVFVPFSNEAAGAVQDFALGWLENGNAWGRPVDIAVGPEGSLYVSDDSGGLIYRITYIGGN